MPNNWVSKIQEWGQAAIDDKEVVLDMAGRLALFGAVKESLAAKENTNPVDIVNPKYEAYTKRVLLPYSGGLDSYIAYWRAKDLQHDVTAYMVRLNTPYADLEMEAAESLDADFEVIDMGDWPERWKPYKTRWQHILPLRNLLIILAIASHDGGMPGEIWLGATSGEIPDKGGDKSLEFFEAADKILATLPVRHVLRFPLRYETKTDLVAWWLKSGRDPEELKKTITCQAGTPLPCGACHACFNRWVAMTNNGITEKSLKNPKSVPANAEKVVKFREALEKRDFSVWGEQRIKQTLSAWEKSNG